MSNITVTELNTLRNKVLSMLSNEIDKNMYDTFFKNTYIHSVDGKNVNIVCDSALTKTLLNDKFADRIKVVIDDMSSTDFDVFFYSQEDVASKNIKNNLSTPKEKQFFASSVLDPDLVFDSFVVGANNNEAHKASLIVATSPGKLYQTLFIYGGSGLGKTHLLTAIGNYIKTNNPDKKVLFCSSQDFINEYLDFVNGDSRKEQLINYLKKFDVFLIDDIQMLKDKKKTQEFFFNIYEDFRQNHKQVVITSDKLPGELDGIDNRIITRFTSGLSVPIYKPSTETCIEILKMKISRGGYDITRYDDEAIYFLADKFKDSIRSLEGALMRLNFYVSINKLDHVDLQTCIDALQGMIDCSDANTKVTEQKILNAVATYYNLSVSQITGKIKTANVATARHISIYLIRTLLDTPYKKIGLIFSNRDHSTIMHSVEKVEASLKKDPQLAVVVAELKRRLEST